MPHLLAGRVTSSFILYLSSFDPLLLFLAKKAYQSHQAYLTDVLSKELPYTFCGFSTNFGESDEVGVRLLKKIEEEPINHQVEIFTIQSFSQEELGVNPEAEVTVLDWLTLPEQKLLSITSGWVSHDEGEQLPSVRNKFRYDQRDVRLYLLTAQWTAISQQVCEKLKAIYIKRQVAENF